MPSLTHLVARRRAKPPAEDPEPEDEPREDPAAEAEDPRPEKPEPEAEAPRDESPEDEPRADQPKADIEEPEAGARADVPEDVPDEKSARKEPSAGVGEAGTERVRKGRWRRAPVVLGAATVLLGGLAVWFHGEADGLRSGGPARNAALTDGARTSEVKGQIGDAVNAVFSYNYTDMATTEQAAKKLLTGRAVGQYDAMLAGVRAQAPKQKLVLTTTVTDSGVEMLEGGRARLLLFADQRNTRTAAKDTTYAAAMIAVDAVWRDGRWKIANIDTLGVPR